MSHFFNLYPDNIFFPLAGENRTAYLDLIVSMHSKFFSESAEFIDTSIPIPRIKAFIEEALHEENWNTEGEGEGGCIKSRAIYVYNRLLETGWLNIRKDGIKQDIYMSSKVSMLVDFIENIQLYSSGEIGGGVLSIRNNLESIISPRKRTSATDISQMLDQVVQDTQSLSKTMKNLALHLTDISQDFRRFTKLDEKMTLFFEEFIKNSSFSDYNLIKGQHHPFRFKSEILDMLYSIEYEVDTTEQVVNSIQEHNRLKTAQDLPYEKALESLKNKVRLIRNIFENTEYLIEKIDASHARLGRQVNESIKYHSRTPSSAINDFESLLKTIKETGVKGTISNPLPVYPFFSLELVARVPKQRKQITQRKNTIKTLIPEEVIRQKEEKRLALERRTINQEKLTKWLDALFNQHGELGQINSINIPVSTIEDFVAFTVCRRLGIEDEKLHRNYSDTLTQYNFILAGDDLIEHEHTFCQPFNIVKMFGS
ncbi:Wadjet anti-phage system protein JetA family protein [Marinomonas sp. MED121]|uniref:Wadjet anti-phage system protein JetA family protein n=1 Tax=Marinomonas sp. MED121 TaxID=314277 RepID=UPI0002F92FEF|nr:Wadjet anti-phage system protein JetA family protein [Marinomonas sp. MED121]